MAICIWYFYGKLQQGYDNSQKANEIICRYGEDVPAWKSYVPQLSASDKKIIMDNDENSLCYVCGNDVDENAEGQSSSYFRKCFQSAFLDDRSVLLNTIKKLKSYGFAISMDDFGEAGCRRD